MRIWRALAGVVLAAVIAFGAGAGTDTVALLHTNDVHDHIRPNYDGVGGLAYVAGYVRKVRAERPDTLLVDAGDLMNKGNLMATRSDSVATFEAMGQVRYDLVAPGNHDFSRGIEHLQLCAQSGPVPIHCVNVLDEAGRAPFPVSKLVDVDGVKVGVVGVTTAGCAEGVFDRDATIRALAQEAERLDIEAHLIVAVCHFGSKECAAMSPLAPAVDVFVAGHQHEALQEPKVVEETGAFIVGAGDFARYVGRLDLTIDLDTEAIVCADGWLALMSHAQVPYDEGMAEWIEIREQAICPEATTVLARAREALDAGVAARLAAEGMRAMAGAEIGLIRVRRMLAGLPEGDIDINAAFMTLRDADMPVVVTNLSGAEIGDFIGSVDSVWHRIEWAGFRAKIDYTAPKGRRVGENDLDPKRYYLVAMSQEDWVGAVMPRLTYCPDRAVAVFAFTPADALVACLTNFGDEALSADAVAAAVP